MLLNYKDFQAENDPGTVAGSVILYGDKLRTLYLVLMMIVAKGRYIMNMSTDW